MTWENIIDEWNELDALIRLKSIEKKRLLTRQEALRAAYNNAVEVRKMENIAKHIYKEKTQEVKP